MVVSLCEPGNGSEIEAKPRKLSLIPEMIPKPEIKPEVDPEI